MGKVKIGLIVLGSIALIGLVGAALVSKAAPEPMVRKIVVFQPGVVNESAREALITKFGGVITKDLPLIYGMAVLLPPSAEKALAQQAEVLRIDNDDVVFAFARPICGDGAIHPSEQCDEPGLPNCPEGQVCENCKCVTPEEPTPGPLPQTISWGVDRIDADLGWATSTGSGVKVAILDTGIDIDHPDLSVAGGVNVLGPFRTEKYNDDNGHGTHVAGIAAALNNAIGVVGVAPNAELYAVKAFNRRAIGFDSDIIDGIDWCINNTTYGRMDVINMSFGGSDNTSLHQAIQAAYNAGIVMVAAAGNNGTTDGKIVYPAKYSETIAVSATNIDDGLAYFSSYGLEIDLAAPGQDINSTWNDGYYYVGSGTSMATPHVVGTAALVLADPNLKCDTDSNGICSPAEVKQRLESTAELLSGLNSDQQGSGLVDAEKAVIQ